jgi:hypothetical protein
MCNIFDGTVTTTTASSVFSMVNVREQNILRKQGKPVDKGDHSVSVKEFMSTIIIIAVEKYKHLEMAPTDAITKLFEEHIVKSITSNCLDPIPFRLVVKEDTEVAKVYTQKKKLLRKRFEVYAGANENMEESDDGSVDIMEFEQLLGDYGLFDGNLTKRVILSLFSMARDENYANPYCLRFISFVELLMRCACIKFNGHPAASGQPVSPDADLGKPVVECVTELFNIINNKVR